MIQSYELGQDREWKALVESFADYDVYYLPGYARGFQLHGDGEPLLLYYESDNLRAINVVMRRDVADAKALRNKIEHGQLYDLSTPYGYGGWLLEGEGDVNRLFQDYESFCREAHIVSGFVRFHPVLGNAYKVADFYDTSCLGPTIALDLDSKELIWENMTSKNRNMVRKAQKNGIEIRYGSTPELYHEFKRIYDDTMDRDNADGYYYFNNSMYQSLLADMSDNATVFYASLEDEIIAASIMIFANGHLNYHLSGSRAEYRNLAPSNLLLCEAAKWGAERGMTSFHLGGGVGARKDGLYRFKSSFFRGEPLTYVIGKKVFDTSAYAALVEKAGCSDGSFFPLYRS